ncbi:MAG: hypothetical protein ABIU63_16870 [Chitinophagaceae bacterium]
MFQPFIPFKLEHLETLPSLNKRYIISQSYERANDHFSEEKKIGIIFSTPNDLGLAKIHLNAVRHDKYAAILDLENPRHVEKIKEMLASESQYKVFWSIFNKKDELEKRLDLHYGNHIQRYIKNNTTWAISRDIGFNPKFHVIFAELFVLLKYGSQTLRVKFEDIEKA